jgi:Flp pilus assembly protein CpaB
MTPALLIIAAVAVVVIGIVAIVAYRMTRRDPPGYYDRQPPNPGFRSNRGRGR